MIFLAESTFDVWRSEVRRWLQRETGGMLLGYEDVAGNLVVTQATRPGPTARHGWFSFEPDHEWDRELLAEIYTASGRRIRYLGEWHSHWLRSLRPSHDDLETMRLIADHEAACIRHPLSAIVGRRPVQDLKWALYRFNEVGCLEPVPAVIVAVCCLPEMDNSDLREGDQPRRCDPTGS